MKSDILDAFKNIVRRMPNYITKRNEKVWIQNPVDPFENFADRWEENPQCERKFREWLKELEIAFGDIIENNDPNKASRLLEALFGENITKATIQKYIETTSTRVNPIYPVVSSLSI